MKYYCIGIKGSGMAPLAQILYDLGKFYNTDFSSLKVKHCTSNEEFILKDLINNKDSKEKTSQA